MNTTWTHQHTVIYRDAEGRKKLKKQVRLYKQQAKQHNTPKAKMGWLGWDSNPLSLKHVHSVYAALLFQFSLHVYLCHGEVKLQQVLLALVEVTAETELLVELE